MSTAYAPPTQVQHRWHINPWLVAVIVLGVAVVALGTWVIVDRYTGGDTATRDATTLIDDISTAYTTGDPNAIPTLYASNAVIRSFGTNETYVGVASISELADGSFTVERVSPVTVKR